MVLRLLDTGAEAIEEVDGIDAIEAVQVGRNCCFGFSLQHTVNRIELLVLPTLHLCVDRSTALLGERRLCGGTAQA